MFLGDAPALSFMVASLGWLTQVARGIDWGKVSLMGLGFLQLLAGQRKPASTSPWVTSERRGQQKPLAHGIPRRIPFGLCLAHHACPACSHACAQTCTTASGELPLGLYQAPSAT